MMREKRKFPFLIHIFICLSMLSSCNKTRNTDVLDTKTRLETTLKKVGSNEVMIPTKDQVIILGTGTEHYQSATLKYLERGVIIKNGIQWKVTSNVNPLPKGVTRTATDEGYEFEISRSDYERKEGFEIDVEVLRKNTVLAHTTIVVNGKTLPMVEKILIRRVEDQIGKKIYERDIVDLTKIFNVVVSPIGASVAVIWKVDNPSLASVDEKGILHALDAGIINISVTPTSNPIISSTTLSLTIAPSTKNFQLKDIIFPLDEFPDKEVLVAWLIYTPASASAEIIENLGPVRLKKDGILAPPAPIIIVEDKLIETNAKFIVTIETPSITTDDRVIKAIEHPSSKVVFSKLVFSEDRVYSLDFLDNSNFAQTNTNGSSSSFILYSPTDNDTALTSNDEFGVWFAKDRDITTPGFQGQNALNLPILPNTGPWIYEAWITYSQKIKVSLGKFFNPTLADNNAYYYSNTLRALSFPGEDLLNNKDGGTGVLLPNPFPIDARNKKIFITLEPATDLASSDLTPYFFIILTGEADENIGRDVNHPLTPSVPSAMLEVTKYILPDN